MTNFNIHGSKVEQLNNEGNNYKLTSGSGSNAVSEKGNVVQTEGTQNKVQVDQPKESLWAALWKKVKTIWRRFFPVT